MWIVRVHIVFSSMHKKLHSYHTISLVGVKKKVGKIIDLPEDAQNFFLEDPSALP